MSRWVVKSAHYNYKQSGWFAYRSGQFHATATHFRYHHDAFAYAESEAVRDYQDKMWC